MIENIGHLMNVANGSTLNWGYQRWLPFYNMNWVFGLIAIGVIGFIGFLFTNHFQGIFRVMMLNLAFGLSIIHNAIVWAVFPGIGANPTLAASLWLGGVIVWGYVLWIGTGVLIDDINGAGVG